MGLVKKRASFQTQWRMLRGDRLHPGSSSGGVAPYLDPMENGPVPFPQVWPGTEGTVRKLTPGRQWGVWGPLCGGKKKWLEASQRSGNPFFFSPYRSISWEVCKGQCCFFKVPSGFTSWVTLGFLCGKHEDPISFPYNSKRSEKQGPFRLESVWL